MNELGAESNARRDDKKDIPTVLPLAISLHCQRKRSQDGPALGVYPLQTALGYYTEPCDVTTRDSGPQGSRHLVPAFLLGYSGLSCGRCHWSVNNGHTW